jgi:hypothetical protein
MKKVEITNYSHAEARSDKEIFGFLKIPVEHKLIRAEGENLEVSDGYHTFDELYDHRITLYIALCKKISLDSGYGYVWRSKTHADGSSFEGWFILGIGTEKGKQITYHIPLSRWEECSGIAVEPAPEFDGHTSQDVLERIKQLYFLTDKLKDYEPTK